MIRSFFLLVLSLTILLFSTVSLAQETFDIKFKDTSLLTLNYDLKCNSFITSKQDLLDLNQDLVWLSTTDDSVFQDFCVVQLKNQKTYFYGRIDKLKLDYEAQISTLTQEKLLTENENLKLNVSLNDAIFKNRVILISSFVILTTIVTHAYIY
tara:strand:+ start:199 stop:657 length:459 start_codon:yes stop_codon:yes gene_type:complete